MSQLANTLVILLMLSGFTCGQISPNPSLIQYVGQHQGEVEKVDSALSIVRTLYPDWNSCYKSPSFDCGEMASFVRWHLINCGIVTHYVVGIDKGYNDNRGHIWLETENGLWIEPTTLSVVTDDGRKLYTDVLHDVTAITDEQAMEHYPDDMKWWISMPNIQHYPE